MAPDGAMPTAAKELGGAVRRRRRLLRLTQLQLAKLAGCGADFLYDLEAGKTTIQLGKLVDVLRVLGLQLRLESGTGGLVIDEAVGPAAPR